LREAQAEKPEKVKTLTAKTAKTPTEYVKSVVGGDENPEKPQNGTAKTAKTVTGHQDKASEIGLVATWSREFGFLSLHDSTTGEWHDLPTKGVPDWAVREARKRRELYKSGNCKAYRLTSSELEKVWEEEQQEMWELPAITDKGIVYEDYLEDEED